MSQTQTTAETVELEIDNIGGIDRSRADLSLGVTILSGRNATNRTSFLQAIMAACGSDRATLKADTDHGRAVLSIDGEEYTREYTRRNGTVVDSGDPYLADATIADLFAFLTETNEARRAVKRGDDLRELIMRPVDTDRIEAQIDTLEAERSDIEAELEELNDLERRLPDLEEQRQTCLDDIEKTRPNSETSRPRSRNSTKISRKLEQRSPTLRTNSTNSATCATTSRPFAPESTPNKKASTPSKMSVPTSKPPSKTTPRSLTSKSTPSKTK